VTQLDREKVAIVFIHQYKNIVDQFKKYEIKTALGFMQQVELSLYEFTADRPIARKFFNQILEYRRAQDATIRQFGIPVIPETPQEQKETHVDIDEEQMEPVLHVSAKAVEAEKSGYPFEF